MGDVFPHPFTLGEFVRQERLARGLTQEGCAEILDLSDRQLRRIETGPYRNPLPGTLLRISKWTGVPVDQLPTWPGSADSPAGGALEPKQTLTRLVGRRSDMDLIAQHPRGGPPLLVLSGEPGIGKSRLLVEAGTYARGIGIKIIQGAAHRPAGSVPYEPVADAVRLYLGRQTRSQKSRDLAGCAYLTAVLPELANQWHGPPGQTLPEGQVAHMIAHAVRRFLDNIRGDDNILLLLDDLHLAGRDGLDLLLCVLELANATDLRIIAAYGNSEPTVSNALANFLGMGAQRGLIRMHAVEPLSIEDSTDLLRSALDLPSRVTESELGRAARRADGVPLNVISFAEWLPEQAGRHRSVASLPWTVRSGYTHRLQALPKEVQALIEAVAVIGGQVSRSLVGRVADLSGKRLGEGLCRACGSMLLDEVGGHDYCLRHNVIGEAIRESIDGARLAHIHRTIADALSDAPEDLRRRTAAVIAQHYLNADELDLAIEFSLLAGEYALDIYAYHESSSQFERAMGLAYKTGNKFSEFLARRRLGHVLLLAGCYEQATGVYEEGTRRAVALHDEAEHAACDLGLGDARLRLSQFSSALIALETARTLFMRRNDPRGLARALGCIGRVYWGKAKWGKALQVFNEQHQLAISSGDRFEEGRALGDLGLTKFRQGRFQEAQNYYQQQLAIAEMEGNLRLKLMAVGNSALVLEVMGAPRQALENMEQAVDIAERIGDRRAVGIWHGNLANIRKDLGQHAEAYAGYMQYMQIALEIGDLTGYSHVVTNLGSYCRRYGLIEPALDGGFEGLRVALRIGEHYSAAVSLENIAEAFECAGNLRQAEHAFGLALGFDLAVESEPTEVATRANWAYFLFRQGRYSDAREKNDLAKALSISMGHAEAEVETSILDAVLKLKLADFDAHRTEQELAAIRAQQSSPADQANVDYYVALHVWPEDMLRRREVAGLYAQLYSSNPEAMFARRYEDLSGEALDRRRMEIDTSMLPHSDDSQRTALLAKAEELLREIPAD